jgi:hypothetical protein
MHKTAIHYLSTARDRKPRINVNRVVCSVVEFSPRYGHWYLQGETVLYPYILHNIVNECTFTISNNFNNVNKKGPTRFLSLHLESRPGIAGYFS